MSIDNICLQNVPPDYYVSNQNYQPAKCTEPVNYVFQEIFEDKVDEAGSYYSGYSTYQTAVAVESEDTTCPVLICDSVPPPIYTPPAEEKAPVNETAPVYSTAPITPTPTTNVVLNGIDCLDKYYPISSDDVIPKIRELRWLINNADLSGKTNEEKYTFIERRFADAFGDDFLLARNMNLPSSMFYMIGVEFNDTLGRHIENPEQVNRERLYGDASVDSVQNSIREKYPEDLTNRDLFLMVNEMRNAGVLDSSSIRTVGVSGAQRIMDTMALLRTYARFNSLENNGALQRLSLSERDKLWIGMMNDRVINEDLLLLHNVWKLDGRVAIGQDTAPFLVKHMGGMLDENGFFILPGGGEHCWENMFEIILSEMDEYDELIRSRMREIDAIEYKGSGENVVIDDVPGSEEELGMGESSGVEESMVVGESNGAEENMDSEEAGDSDAVDDAESEPVAA